MANAEHVARLQEGVKAWNAWRAADSRVYPDLSGIHLLKATLHEANLMGANLQGAVLDGAGLSGANLSSANLHQASLRGAYLGQANLMGGNLRNADLTRATLNEAILYEASLHEAKLHEANLHQADLSHSMLDRADLRQADLTRAFLREAYLRGADLRQANLRGAVLESAYLDSAKLGDANLQTALLVNTELTGADLTGCRVYGISAWEVRLDEATRQKDLVITPDHESKITVDDIEVAQFVYLLLRNRKIRSVIDTIGRKGVLLLGRFTEGRLETLERLREKLRGLGFVPIVFNFDKPEARDFTETVQLLAGLSHFVIADITKPRSAPLELQATIPNCMVPFVPIIEKGEAPFAMLADLWTKYRDWVLDPISYSSADRLIEILEAEIVRPAQARFDQLLERKAEQLRIREF